MADETEQQQGFTPPEFVPVPETGVGGADSSPVDADRAAADDRDSFAERPEVYVGAAFAGGLALAGLLRYLGR